MDRYSDSRFKQVDEAIYGFDGQQIDTQELSTSPELPDVGDFGIRLAAPKWVKLLPIDDPEELLGKDYLKKVPFSIPISFTFYIDEPEGADFVLQVEGAIFEKPITGRLHEEPSDPIYPEDEPDPGEPDVGPKDNLLLGYRNFNLVQFVKIPAQELDVLFSVKCGSLTSEKIKISIKK